MELKKYLGHHVSFIMNGVKYRIPTKRSLTQDEFCPMLYYTRRLLGYTVYPRWLLARYFLSEVIEVLKRNKVYRHQLKKTTKSLLEEFDRFEAEHKADFDGEFLEVMATNISGAGLNKVNELRGNVGGVLMNAGVKQYLVYSYPYTFLNLCFDNIMTYEECMKQVIERYDADFTEVFLPLKGKRIYEAAIKMMNDFCTIMKEKIPRLTFEGTGCIEKLQSLNKLLCSEQVLHDAFQDAYDDMPVNKRDNTYEELNLWIDEKNYAIEQLSQKYNVKT
jgi:hypothetical protein